MGTRNRLSAVYPTSPSLVPARRLSALASLASCVCLPSCARTSSYVDAWSRASGGTLRWVGKLGSRGAASVTGETLGEKGRVSE